AVIRRLVNDFNVPVEIVGVQTVREPDGLALSSRNQRLGPEERKIAIALYEGLVEARRQISSGATNAASIRKAAEAVAQRRAGVRLKSLEIVDPDEMQPVERVNSPVVAAGAIWVGSTRLIDNLLCTPPATM